MSSELLQYCKKRSGFLQYCKPRAAAPLRPAKRRGSGLCGASAAAVAHGTRHPLLQRFAALQNSPAPAPCGVAARHFQHTVIT
jgi:hypothetical protein